ncbi:MAG: Eco57I restriction-modification methylase domain-containing protein, partial [Pseudomonadota bacterium]
MSSRTDRACVCVSSPEEDDRKAEYGQYPTPAPIARFMASLFPASDLTQCRLLDAGAGTGSLSEAFLEQWREAGFGYRTVMLDAFEIDAKMRPDLERTLSLHYDRPGFVPRILTVDFIEAAVDAITGNLFVESLPQYTHAILNPPYKKIRSSSRHRALLRRAGIETVNLYSAFVALTLELLAPGGQLVAIIPRSFCNGPYYKPFRKLILERAAIRRIHLFAARDKAFKDDGVLQENVIILLERGGRQGDVVVSSSTDGSFEDLSLQTHPFHRIVSPSDAEQCIHVPTSSCQTLLDLSSALQYSLGDVGIRVSTGPVVDFRLKTHLRMMPVPGSVPLLYPGHFTDRRAQWPKPGFKKPNAIMLNGETEKWLYPNGFYTVVRRFTSKEEKRRIVASVVEPHAFLNMSMLGFENHLNVFHRDRQGLPQVLAVGLAAYLNTTALDDYFRRFNGHTQVNATDLRLLKYPSREMLIAMGEWAMSRDSL